jgi:hypothetical protein
LTLENVGTAVNYNSIFKTLALDWSSKIYQVRALKMKAATNSFPWWDDVNRA